MRSRNGDVFYFNGGEYALICQDTAFDFYPYEYGISPFALNDELFRGYRCVYRITDGGIYLEELYVNTADGNYPDINGVSAVADDAEGSLYGGHHAYKDIGLRIPVTGRILLADRFLDGEFLYLGYERPWTYDTVFELIFEDDVLTEVNDLCETVAEMRRRQTEADRRVNEAYEKEGRIITDNLRVDFGINAWWM